MSGAGAERPGPGRRDLSRRDLGRGVFSGLVLLAGGSMLSACAGVPGGSGVVDVSRDPAPEPGAAFRVPRADAQPTDIVRDFLSVLGQVSPDNSNGPATVAARKFVTTESAASWPPAGSRIQVLADQVGVLLDPKARPDTDTDVQVTLRGTSLGSTDRTGVFIPDGDAFGYVFRLTRIGGVWTITDPPPVLIALETDFENAFVRQSVYFLDHSGTVVVPDQRYVPKDPTLRLAKMMDLLLAGPAPALTHNPPVVRNQLQGMELRGNVDSNEKATTVDLQQIAVPDAATRLAPAALRGLAAQVVFTLSGANIVGPVVIRLGGQLLEAAVPQYTSGTVATFDPDQTPTNATTTDKITSDPFYLDAEGEIHDLLDLSPVWGEVGHGELVVTSAALSAATGVLAVVSANTLGGKDLSIGRPLAQQEVQRVLGADSLTAPSINRAGDAVWVVQNGGTGKSEIYQISVQPGDRAAAAASRVTVNAPELAGRVVSGLALSPDGVRIAVIADGKLLVGAIAHSSADSGTTGGAEPTSAGGALGLVNLAELNTGITNLGGTVLFSSSTTLVVTAAVASSKYYRGIVRVSVDGSRRDDFTTTDLTSSVDSVAVNAPDGTVYAGFDGRIYQLDGAFTTGRWLAVDAGSVAVVGSNPFYPS